MDQWNAGRKAATRRPSGASRSHAVGPPQQNTAPMATEQMIQHDVLKTSKNDLAFGIGCDKHDILIHPVS